MKTAFSLGLALTLGAFSVMGAPKDAHAGNLNNAGTICKNYDAGQALDIDYLVSGARNLATSSRYVICPVVLSPNSNSNVKVHVNGFASSGQTIFCTLFGIDNTGVILGSKSFSSAMTGNFDVSLKVPAKGSSNASVLCLLPPSSTGIIYDIDVQ